MDYDAIVCVPFRYFVTIHCLSLKNDVLWKRQEQVYRALYSFVLKVVHQMEQRKLSQDRFRDFLASFEFQGLFSLVALFLYWEIRIEIDERLLAKDKSLVHN
ncbi:Uncharacterised protein [Streptococcus pneumoniae]|nr:Uncharacterised protein [Streptococcus pneumoniae]